MSGRRLQSAPGRRETQHQGNGSESSSSDDEYEIEMLRKAAKELDVNDSNTEVYRGTGFIYDEVMTHHKCEWDSSYPENPLRITEPFRRIQELGLLDRCHRIPLCYATEDQVLEGHARTHLDRVQSTTQMDLEELKEISANYDSWYANKETYEAALASAGSTLTLLDHILLDKVTNGFALVRPPGHHAMHDEFNGYCTFNNVGLAAKEALSRGLNRVLIVDWDVHHGQGLQRMFYDDPRVLYFSIHRYEHGEFWPNLRESDYDFIGQEKGLGFNVNVPLNKSGMTNSDYMAVLHHLLLPLAYEFGPDIVLVSAGFDSAIGCPEGEMLLTPAMFAHLTHHLKALGSGRVALILEGGYCIESLTEACALSLRSLLGDPCPVLPATEEPSTSICETVLNVIKALRSHWKCFGHYKQTFGEQAPQFEGIASWPPKPGVEFNTSENRPASFPIDGFYPQRSKDEIQHWTEVIAGLVAETNLQKATHKCCYVFDADMRGHKHISSKNHPERPDRISCIYNKMAAWGLLKKCLDVPSREAEASEILWIHTQEYLDELSATPSLTDDELEYFPLEKHYPSIYLNQKSYRCALLSCGSVLNVLDTVLSGQAQTGVAIVRPPGHHAESHGAMGFCFFNNVAVAVKAAQKKHNVNRVLILDWDVHHGNATQHQFYDDPSVLYISLHRFDHGHFFPGSPEADMTYTGRDDGEGYNVNIPWSYGRMGDSEYLTAFHQIVMPIAYQFAPELVLVSAGFDAALGDPLGGYRVTPAGYGHMTHMLSGLANGKMVLALEGGYNLNSISDSMAVCMSVMLGDPCPLMTSLTPCDRAMDTVHDVMEIQKSYWSCLKGKVQIPQTPKPRERGGRPATAPATTVNNKNKKTTTTPVIGKTAGARQSEQPMEAKEPHTTPADVKAVTSDVSMTSLTSDLSMISLTSSPSETAVTLPRSPQPPQSSSSSSGISLSSSSSLSSPLVPTSRLKGDAQGMSKNNNSVATSRDDVKDAKTTNTPDCASANPVPGSSKQADDDGAVSGVSEGAVGGATGVSQRPVTVDDFLKMQGAQQMYAVTPLSWCPHLKELQPMPDKPLNCHDPCSTCGDTSENWVCLVCYKVECSRFVNEHMLYHRLESEHNLTLSYSDISVWCYACDHYVDNGVLQPMKNAAHVSKFGESLPGFD